MKAPITFYCPACNERQHTGTAGQKLTFPLSAKCQKCNADIIIEKSESGGVHLRLVAPIPH